MADKSCSDSPASFGFWQKFFKHRQGLVGLFLLASIILVAVFAPQLAPFDPYEIPDATAEDVLAPPSREHILGQDDIGGDVLSSLIYSVSFVSLSAGSCSFRSVSNFSKH